MYVLCNYAFPIHLHLSVDCICRLSRFLICDFVLLVIITCVSLIVSIVLSIVIQECVAKKDDSVIKVSGDFYSCSGCHVQNFTSTYVLVSPVAYQDNSTKIISVCVHDTIRCCASGISGSM